MGKRLQILAGLFLACVSVHAERLAFTGGTDRNPLLYKPGEEMRFKVTLVDRDSDNRIVKGRSRFGQSDCEGAEGPLDPARR